MDEETSNTAPPSVRSPWPAFVPIGVGALAVWIASGYDAAAREVPIPVGILLIVLGLFDLGSRTRMPFKRALVSFWGADFANREMKFTPNPAREVVLIGWVVLCGAGMLLVGIMVTVPVFCIAFMRVQGRRPWLETVIVAVLFSAFTYVTFEWLLHYQLYRGALFTREGFSAW